MKPLAVLVGPPASGKSAVGQLLADLCGVAYRDTDDDVEEMTGMTVPEVFAAHGEQCFRVLERDAVRQALQDHSGVLALGGGAVLDPDTRRRLAGCCVVHLEVDAEEVADRIGSGAGRPLLAGAQAALRWRELLTARLPLYREVATLTVSTAGQSLSHTAVMVLKALQEHPAAVHRAAG